MIQRHLQLVVPPPRRDWKPPRPTAAGPISAHALRRESHRSLPDPPPSEILGETEPLWQTIAGFLFVTLVFLCALALT